jgi:deoxyribodipyrimidine photo-lyase
VSVPVPALRIRSANDRPLRRDGEFVLYWSIAARRTQASYALQRAVELACELARPLLVLEPLRCGYRWASARLHAFVLQGMADNASAYAAAGVRYLPYVEPQPGAGKGLLAALAAHACAVVTDDFPAFFLPRMVAAAARAMPVRLEAVDGNGLLPLRLHDRELARAVDFRRFLQRELAGQLACFPAGDPLYRADLGLADVPRDVAARWPAASDALLAAEPAELARLPIDHRVGAVATRGGAVEAGRTLRAFLRDRLPRYSHARSHPDADAGSGLSPYLHFGHIGVHQVFAALAARESWSSAKLRPGADGRRGWLGMDENAEAFLDELLVWRELGFRFAAQRADHASYDSVPAWARMTLAAHAGDPREHVYSLDELAAARTHDPVWNAAQTQLRETGVLHNYLRMLWGKKVLEWSSTPQEAFAHLVELNNRYALDGRDPNSYTGIAWTFGRHDRPWAPERPIFGVVRYMSSANTVKKLRMKQYLARWSG